MIIKNAQVDRDGIYIPTETLIELRSHYEGVQIHCQHNNSERLGKYYEGKTDILSDIILLIKTEQKLLKL